MEVFLIVSLIVCLIPIFIIGSIYLRYRQMFKALRNAKSGTDIDNLIESFMGKGGKNNPLVQDLLTKFGKKDLISKNTFSSTKNPKKSGPIEYSKDKSDQFEDAEFRDS